MDPIIGAALIGGGTALLGSALSDRSTDRAMDRSAAERTLDRDFQREYAQHGIRWRINDGRAAGLHPLIAAGVQPTPYSPVGDGGTVTGSAKGDGIRAAGAMLAESLARSGREKAETRLLNAQADIYEQQGHDSQLARMKQLQVNDVVQDGYHDVNNPKRTTKLKFAGIPISTAPFSSDAQTFEDRYGEAGGAVLGLGNIPADVLQSLYELVEKLGSNKHRYVPESRFNIK